MSEMLSKLVLLILAAISGNFYVTYLRVTLNRSRRLAPWKKALKRIAMEW